MVFGINRAGKVSVFKTFTKSGGRGFESRCRQMIFFSQNLPLSASCSMQTSSHVKMRQMYPSDNELKKVPNFQIFNKITFGSSTGPRANMTRMNVTAQYRGLCGHDATPIQSLPRKSLCSCLITVGSHQF